MFWNCLDDVHGYLAALTPFVLDVFPFIYFLSVCLSRVSFLSLFLSLLFLLCFAMHFSFCPAVQKGKCE